MIKLISHRLQKFKCVIWEEQSSFNALIQTLTATVPRHTLTSCQQRMKFECCRLIKSYVPLYMYKLFLLENKPNYIPLIYFIVAENVWNRCMKAWLCLSYDAVELFEAMEYIKSKNNSWTCTPILYIINFNLKHSLIEIQGPVLIQRQHYW